MKTQFKYIHFDDVSSLYQRKTRVWECLNNSKQDLLGFVKWHSPWRQYCFVPNDDTFFSASCLVDINFFIATLNKEHKK